MKRLTLSVMLAVMGSTLAAQQPTPQRADTGEAGRLRRQIEERFTQRVQEELKLTPDQVTKLRASQERFGPRRRDLMRQQMGRRMALQAQMRPGEAANADSVRKLLDGLRAGRAEMLRIEQEEDRELAGYLTPVQQARYELMRERLQRRVNEMREQRRGRMGPGRGMRPGGRPDMGPRRRPA